jgi:hypothetical protein
MLVLIALLTTLLGGTIVSSDDVGSGVPDHHGAIVAPVVDDGMSGGPAAK